MISVIVPVYNVEPYLRKCLDSIVNQTYRDLEILVIDDGSTDGSGKICDEYAEKDGRIRVFHTENRGLSCARNLGLDNANGEWIGFVDSDDWIEPDMYECLLSRAVETRADVVECGVLQEYPERTEERKQEESLVPGIEAVSKLIHGGLGNAVWRKLWRIKCFEHIRFPERRVFEDVATTYRVFAETSWVANIEESKYHHVHRNDSLSKRINMSNLVGRWMSHNERYDFLDKQMFAEANHELRICAYAAARTWAHYYDCGTKDRENSRDEICEMHSFVKQHIPLFGDSRWSVRLRVGVFFPHFQNAVSFRMAWLINRFIATISKTNRTI